MSNFSNYSSKIAVLNFAHIFNRHMVEGSRKLGSFINLFKLFKTLSSLAFSFVSKMFAKNILLFAIILLICCTIQISSKFFKFRSIKCTSSNKTLQSDFKCFLKAYSRRNTTLNIIATITDPIYDMKVSQ